MLPSTGKLMMEPENDESANHTISKAKPLHTAMAALLAAGALVLLIYTALNIATDETKVANTNDKALDLRPFLSEEDAAPDPKRSDRLVAFRKKMTNAIPLDIPGVTNPRFYDPKEVIIPDYAEVMGVIIKGVPRAYLLAGMYSGESHVVHDTLEGSNLTLTYCDLSDCVRAYDRGSMPSAQVRMGGWDGNEMTLLIDQTRYTFSGTNLPLPNIPFQRTTWGAWLKDNPGTKVFIGDLERLNNNPPSKRIMPVQK